ncbi:hypothetical protein L2E82_46881 [Cichorium intybus]|uniref:Uncharacterized protein n=1 Tax=Cichorium intybus TaxID=13427 RepID=A0ACB8YV37_CICIN|nr:hypothetical protein L2E82_46881 [Cichorium intybus]
MFLTFCVTDIEWLHGKCLTQNILKKKPKKGSKNAKPITKTENCESFFNFFSPPQVPEDDDDINEDVAEELQNLMEQYYDIGSTIRDKIISWFTGEAAEEDEFEGIDEDEEEEDNSPKRSLMDTRKVELLAVNRASNLLSASNRSFNLDWIFWVCDGVVFDDVFRLLNYLKVK